MIILPMTGSLALSAIMVLTQPPLFEATATIQLHAQPIVDSRAEGVNDQQIQTGMALLKSPSLIRSVLEEYDHSHEQLNLAQSPVGHVKDRLATLMDRFLRWLHRTPQATPLDRKIATLAAQIDTERIARSNVVEVTFSGQDPDRTAEFVNDLLRHHIDWIAKLREKSGARIFFERQADLLAERRKAATEALVSFRREQGSYLESNEAELRSLISGLESQRISTETLVLELQAKIQYLVDEMELFPQTIAAEETVTEHESLGFLRSRLLELEVERSELLSQYTPTSRIVQNVERQIEEAKRLLEEKGGQTLSELTTSVNPSYQALEIELLQAQTELSAARARLAALVSQIDNYRANLTRLERGSGELERLESELDNAREAHQLYLKETESARLVSALDESRIVNVTVVETAQPPVAPKPSRRVLKLLIGALFGLGVGLGTAYLRDLTDPTVKNAFEVSRLADLSVMAEIPVR